LQPEFKTNQIAYKFIDLFIKKKHSQFTLQLSYLFVIGNDFFVIIFTNQYFVTNKSLLINVKQWLFKKYDSRHLVNDKIYYVKIKIT